MQLTVRDVVKNKMIRSQIPRRIRECDSHCWILLRRDHTTFHRALRMCHLCERKSTNDDQDCTAGFKQEHTSPKINQMTLAFMQVSARVVAQLAALQGVPTYAIEFVDNDDKARNFWGIAFPSNSSSSHAS